MQSRRTFVSCAIALGALALGVALALGAGRVADLLPDAGHASTAAAAHAHGPRPR